MLSEPLPEFSLIIPAAGTGLRFGGVKKQFEKLAGQGLLARVLQRFLAFNAIQHIIVCVPEEELGARRAEVTNPKVQIVAGGDSRPASVRKGFFALGDLKDDAIVLIHDAVRPLLTPTLIEKVVRTTSLRGAAIPVLMVTDTIKEVDPKNIVVKTVPRDMLRAVQTPQGFKTGILGKTYARFQRDDPRITDEAALVEAAGFPVVCVDGESDNIKITTPFDLDVAELILNQGRL